MSRGHAWDCAYKCDLCEKVYLRVPWDYDRKRCPSCCRETGVPLPPPPPDEFPTLGATVGAALARNRAIGAARRRIRGNEEGAP